jgi:long-chain acyl-CoA synthetase
MTLYPRMTRKPPFSVDAPGYTPVEGETLPRRNPLAGDKLVTTLANGTVKTVFDLLKRSTEKFGDAKAIGTRTLIRTHKETKRVKKIVDGKEEEVDKEWTYYELTGYKYMSFKEYEVLWQQLGAGFRKLGLAKDDRVHIFAATRSVELKILPIRANSWCIAHIGLPSHTVLSHSQCP